MRELTIKCVLSILLSIYRQICLYMHGSKRQFLVNYDSKTKLCILRNVFLEWVVLVE